MSTIKLPAASGGGSISLKGPSSAGSDTDFLDTSGNLNVSGDIDLAGKIKLPHSSGNSMSLAAPATNPSGDLTLTLPTTIGSNGQYMKVDGSGNLGWVTPPTIPAGGKILQAKNNTTTSGVNSTTSSWTNFSACNMDFTPTAADSTLILQVMFQAWCYRSDAGDGPIAKFQVSKDDNSNALLAPLLATGHHDTQVELYGSMASSMSESAGNTTQRTYKIYYKLERGTSMQINPNSGSRASITVWEVAA